MNKLRILFFYIFLVIALISTIVVYAKNPESGSVRLYFLVTLLVLFLSAIFTCIAALARKRHTKKLLLRIQLVQLSLLAVISIFLRIADTISGIEDTSLFLWKIVGTIFYILLFIFTVVLTRDVYKKLLKMYNRNNF